MTIKLTDFNVLSIFLMALLVCFSFPLISFAVGQMTEPILVENALRGQKITDKITLINSENEKKIFQIKADGAIKDWATFYQLADSTKSIAEIEVAPAFYQSIGVDFRVPSDIPNGTYKGTIDVIFSPEKSTSDRTATVNTSVSRPVSITVSDKEVIDIQASIVPLSYIVKSGDPAQIKIIYNNKSNIAVKPSVQLKITGANFNAIFPYPDNMDAVKAGEYKEMPLFEWQTVGQPLGDYVSEVTVLANGQSVKTERITFTIRTSNDAMFANVANVSGGNSFIFLSVMAAGVLLAIGLILFKKKFSKKQITV